MKPSQKRISRWFAIRDLDEWDWASSEKAFRRALALDPNCALAHQWYAQHCFATRGGTKRLWIRRSKHPTWILSLSLSLSLSSLMRSSDSCRAGGSARAGDRG